LWFNGNEGKKERKMLTVKEAAEHLRMSAKFVYRLVEGKQLNYTKLGNRIRIDKGDLDEYLQRSRVETRRPSTTTARRVLKHVTMNAKA
jgi:excisionase family DNA binding protein